MTEVVVFENPGEIDPLMIRTFGVSVKETEDPIGFFGTGLKYALAILLRTGHDVQIQSGERVHCFALQDAIIRSQSFQLVTMDGEQLGFTDQVGKNWKTWMAYRELHCNCRDEGGAVYVADDWPAPQAGVTRVAVTGDDLRAVHDARSEFILAGEPWLRLDGVDVHEGEARGIFYRGILVHRFDDEKTRSRYTYCMTRSVDLTEDRTSLYPSFLQSQISAAILGAADQDFLRGVLALPDDYYEHELDFQRSWGQAKPGGGFLAAVDHLQRDRAARTNGSAIRQFKEAKRRELGPTPLVLSGVERTMLDRAITFCKKIGFDADDYQMVVTDSLGAGVLGMAEGGRVYLSRQAFNQGTKRLAGTVLEEICHLKYGYADESRAFQDFLIDKLVSLGEEMQGEPL